MFFTKEITNQVDQSQLVLFTVNDLAVPFMVKHFTGIFLIELIVKNFQHTRYQ